MIVFGSCDKERLRTTGRFFCPVCRDQGPYNHIDITRYFTLYFIPLIPMETVGSYVECCRCRGKFEPDVLSLSREEFEAAMQPWKCAGCGNVNPPDEERCLSCGTVRALPGSAASAPSAAGAVGAPAGESIPILAASPDGGSRPAGPPEYSCPICAAQIDTQGWDGSSLCPCPACGVKVRPMADRRAL